MTEQETNAEKRLETVQKKVEGWRKSRSKLGPMPAELWAEAISLAREIGVSGVAGKLGMNHGALSSRVDPSRALRPRRRKRAGLSKFVEITTAPEPLPVRAEKPSTVIELTSATGERLTVRMSQSVDIGALVANFQARQ